MLRGYKRLLSIIMCISLIIGIIGTFRIMVSAVTVEDEIELQVINNGFEDELVNGKITGWDYWKDGLKDGISISSDIYYEGSKSLKLDRKGPVAAESSKIPVEGGKTYRSKAKLYLESVQGDPRFWIRWFGSDGKNISSSYTTLKGSTLPLNSWIDISVEGDAPENATSATMFFYASSATTMRAYFDDVRFFNVLKYDDELQLPFKYGTPIDLGDATVASKTQGAVIGNDEVYFATNGAVSKFYALDGTTGEVKFSQTLPGVDVVWGINIGADGNVYFSGTTNSILYRYIPSEKRIENLGGNPSGKFVWDIDTGNDGKVYGSTYPNGKIFEYDINTNQFRDLGVLKEGQQYVRGSGVKDNYLYAGTGANAYFYRINRTTYEKEEIQLPITGASTMISNVWVYNGKIFVAYGTSLLILDENTHEVVKSMNWQDPVTFDGMISSPSPYNNNLVYLRNKNTSELCIYNTQTNEVKAVTPNVELPQSSVKAMNWVKLNSGEKAGKTVLAIITAEIKYVLYDPEDNWMKTIYPSVDAAGILMQSLEKGPDSKLYMGGYMGAMSIYDIINQKYERQETAFEQIEGIGFLNGKVYFGTYGGARIFGYDPSKPYNLGNNDSYNPGLVKDIEEEQSRPFVFDSGEEKLFIGTISDYGKLGGALTVYDSKTEEWATYRNIVQDQSIFGLAYKNGFVYGGTTLWGGLGIDPVADEAKVFVWNVETRTKLTEFTPVIPGIKTPQLIGGLSFGADGLLWGVAWGKDDNGKDISSVFAIDTKDHKIVKSLLLYPETTSGSNWRPFYLRWGDDGLLYTTAGRKLTVINPDTLKYKQVITSTVNLMTLGDDGSIYYAQGAKLYKLPVPLSKVEIDSGLSVLGKAETANINLMGTLANSKRANLVGALVKYYSSNPDAVVVENGVITAKNTGTSEIWAEVTLDGVTVTSNKVNIKVIFNKQIISDVSTNMTTLQPNKDFEAEIKLTNNDTIARSVITIVALYDEENKLLYVKSYSSDINAGNTITVSQSLLLPSRTDGCKVKIFVWDGVNLKTTNMIPLIDVITIQ